MVIGCCVVGCDAVLDHLRDLGPSPLDQGVVWLENGERLEVGVAVPSHACLGMLRHQLDQAGGIQASGLGVLRDPSGRVPVVAFGRDLAADSLGCGSSTSSLVCDVPRDDRFLGQELGVGVDGATEIRVEDREAGCDLGEASLGRGFRALARSPDSRVIRCAPKCS